MYHKNSFTSHITLRSVFEAIRECSFNDSRSSSEVSSPSDFPIIVSLEMHCTKPQQERLASMAKEIFGDKLVMPLGEEDLQFPAVDSPEALKGKVMGYEMG